MAMSDWDALAFDHAGKPCGGAVKSDAGYTLEIYKEHLYLRLEGGQGAVIHHGSVGVGGFEIQAARHDAQSAVFCYAMWWHPHKDGSYQPRFFGGIGCRGYDDTVRTVLAKLGRTTEDEDAWYSGWSNEGPSHYIENQTTGEKIEVSEEDFYSYVGVLPETVEAYFAWLKEIDADPEWVERCRVSKPLRFNQGDAFFDAHGMTSPDATPPGEAGMPMVMGLLR